MTVKPKSHISEEQAIITLIQVYLSHTAKWYSSLIASAVGVLALPILALNITITSDAPNTFLFLERGFFSVLTLFLLLASLYFVSKVNYSLALLDDLYASIEVRGTENNLMEYLIQRKSHLLSKVKVFRDLYRFQREVGKWLNLSTILLVLGSFAVGFFLLMLIWWGYSSMWQALFIFAALYLFSLGLLFKQIPIL